MLSSANAGDAPASVPTNVQSAMTTAQRIRDVAPDGVGRDRPAVRDATGCVIGDRSCARGGVSRVDIMAPRISGRLDAVRSYIRRQKKSAGLESTQHALKTPEVEPTIPARFCGDPGGVMVQGTILKQARSDNKSILGAAVVLTLLSGALMWWQSTYIAAGPATFTKALAAGPGMREFVRAESQLVSTRSKEATTWRWAPKRGVAARWRRPPAPASPSARPSPPTSWR
jgi:hypothetical protein